MSPASNAKPAARACRRPRQSAPVDARAAPAALASAAAHARQSPSSGCAACCRCSGSASSKPVVRDVPRRGSARAAARAVADARRAAAGDRGVPAAVGQVVAAASRPAWDRFPGPRRCGSRPARCGPITRPSARRPAAFYERQEQRNAEKLAEDPAAEVRSCAIHRASPPTSTRSSPA